jgi:hypothetical protein
MKTDSSLSFRSLLPPWAVALMLAMAMSPASAQARWVFVNGWRMSPQQLEVLDRVQCTVIPNGSYWLNIATGAWGYLGNGTIQGYLGDLCRTPDTRHRSLSERHRLFAPGELAGVPGGIEPP